MKAIKDLTSNEYYGGLNKRFDNRSTRLYHMGFRYAHSEELGIGVFKRSQYGVKFDSIVASFVMHSDRRVFIDELARYRQR